MKQTDKIECVLAKTPAEMEEVFRLRYQCYHRTGAIATRPDASFSDPFDVMPNHFSFLMRSREEGPLATVRITVVRPDLGWTASPSGTVFGDHPAFVEVAQGSFVEASRLCFGEQARRDVLCRLVANLVALGEHNSVRSLVACPRVEHSHVYQRLFGFRPLAAPRQYFGVNFQTELLGTSLDSMRQVARASKPMASAWEAARHCVSGAQRQSPALASNAGDVLVIYPGVMPGRYERLTKRGRCENGLPQGLGLRRQDAGLSLLDVRG